MIFKLASPFLERQEDLFRFKNGWQFLFEFVQILGMYFDAAVVFVTNS